MGFAAMPLADQTRFNAGLLSFKKAKYAACTADVKSADCTQADALRKAQEDKRLTDKYYAMESAAAKDEWDAAWKTEADKLKATLTAAAKEEAAAADAKRLRTAGESCVAKDIKCAADHCCGTAKIAGKTTGELTICNKSAEKTYKKGTQDYEFACAQGAVNLVASAAAILASSYML